MTVFMSELVRKTSGSTFILGTSCNTFSSNSWTSLSRTGVRETLGKGLQAVQATMNQNNKKILVHCIDLMKARCLDTNVTAEIPPDSAANPKICDTLSEAFGGLLDPECRKES